MRVLVPGASGSFTRKNVEVQVFSSAEILKGLRVV